MKKIQLCSKLDTQMFTVFFGFLVSNIPFLS